MTKKRITGVDIAGRLRWSEGKVSKVLTGRTELGVDELDALCFAVGIPLTEAVRDQGIEFCAEMAPTELKILQQFREETEPVQNMILHVLHVGQQDPRRAHEPKRKKP